MTVLSNIITPSNVLTTTNTATVTNKTLTSPTVAGMTVSDGTANGVTYLNGSKVLTSGSALQFTGSNLSIGIAASANEFGNNLQINQTILNDDNGGTNHLSKNAYYSSGWKYISTDYASKYTQSLGTHQWSIAPSGTAGNAVTFTEGMRLTSTGLGIGTSSPSTKLDVLSANTATDTIGNAFIRTTDAQAADVGGKITLGGLYNVSSYYAFGGIAGKKENSTSNNVAGYLQLLTTTSAGALTERARIDSAGNLGLGATSITPRDSGARTLELYGTSSGRTAIKFTNSTSGTGATDGMFLGYDDNLNFAIVNNESGVITFGTSNTERARIDSSGNLLVGTTTSNSAKLTIANAGAEVFQFYPGITSNENQTLNYNRSTAVYCTNSVYAADHRFFIGGAEKARIDSSGNLLVGTTSSNFQAGERVSITPASGKNAMGIALTNTDTLGIAIYSPYTATAAVSAMKFQAHTAAIVGSITFTSTATAYNTSSDYRLKNTIAPMTGALAKVALLKPCTYKWNADGSDGEGFIAHELAEVVPECVVGEKDAVDANGNPKYQGIDTSFLVATLTAAIQEQQALIVSLKARLDAANL